MNRILYEKRCQCSEKTLLKKKLKLKKKEENPRREQTSLQYPHSSQILSKTFHIKYQKNLSLTAKFILNNFQNKYIYFAIDDLLYSLKSNPIERDNLLAVLYSPILSLQNNFSVNFFDIWIREVYIDEISKPNKFLKNDSEALKQFNYITIKFFYKTRVPVKKKRSLW